MDSIGPWSKQDLFFLDEAGFLGRNVDEIREKARELGIACEEFKDLKGKI